MELNAYGAVGPFMEPSVPWTGLLVVLAVLALRTRMISRGDALNKREALVFGILVGLALVAVPVIELIAR